MNATCTLQASTMMVRSATKSTLDKLWAKRMRKQDPEGYHNRFKDLVAKGGCSPNRCKAGSPPSDRSNDGGMNDHVWIADDNRNDEFDESPSILDPLMFDDVNSITLQRYKLVKWFIEPHF